MRRCAFRGGRCLLRHIARCRASIEEAALLCPAASLTRALHSTVLLPAEVDTSPLFQIRMETQTTPLTNRSLSRISAWNSSEDTGCQSTTSLRGPVKAGASQICRDHSGRKRMRRGANFLSISALKPDALFTDGAHGPGSPGYGPGSSTGCRCSRRCGGPRSSYSGLCCRTGDRPRPACRRRPL